MKQWILVLTLLVLMVGCQKSADVAGPYVHTVACGTLNPAQNLPWLRDRIEQLKIDVVHAATYKGETYIDLYAYHWSCRGCHIYHCDGSLVSFSQLSPTDQQEIISHLWSKEPYILYKRNP